MLSGKKASSQAVLVERIVSVSFDRPAEASPQGGENGASDHAQVPEETDTQSRASPSEGDLPCDSGQAYPPPRTLPHPLLSTASTITRSQSSVDEPTEQTPPLPVANPESCTKDPPAVYPGMTLQFAYEDETDYTTGPIRLVAATDSKRTCTALLMNLDLSKKIQRAVQAQRSFYKDERKIEAEQRALANFMAQLRCDITQHEGYLDDLEQPLGSEQASVKRATDIQQFRAQLERLQILLSDTEARHSNNEILLHTKAEELRRRQGLVSTCLEEAFVDALLLKPADDRPDTPVEAMTIDNEFTKLCEQLQDSHDEVAWDPPNASMIPCPDMLAPPALSTEQETQQSLREACDEAYDELKTAQHGFDSREAVREDERRWNECMAECDEETMDATPEAFDLRWVVRNRRLTRRLIEAEDAFALAKMEAEAAGVELEIWEDEEFGDGDGGKGGYPESLERAMVLDVPVDDVYEWMDGVEGDADVEVDVTELEEWEVGELVIGDDANAFACGKDRARIQRWRDMCGI